jgi:TonB-linked SusC/RagA family outer membrane protein
MKSACIRIGVFLFFFLPSLLGFSQTKISGHILASESNKPLDGVNILVKGTKRGTITDANGDFTIAANAKDVLVCSYTGYQVLEVTVGASSKLNLSMSLATDKMSEVVVVGYGTQNRRNITSAIAKLDSKVLENAPRANVGSALQGTISGLQVVNATGQPGASPLILLRGGASINNPGSPLVVIDGIIRSFNDVASEDIASIELLKDAAATSIYGARANNGVILITTRQGKAGVAQISYKFTGGYNERRKGYTYLNAHDYIYYNRLGNLNSGRTLNQVNTSRGYGLPAGVGGVTTGTGAADLATFDIRAYDPATMSGLFAKGWDTVGDPYGGTIIFKDHGGEIENIVFRNTYTQDHYVNVTGGNDKGKYFASFDYYNEDGVIVGSGYKRYSGVLNGSYKVKPNIEVSTGVNLSTSSQLGVNGSEVNNLYRNLTIWPTMNPWLDSAKTKSNPGNGINDGNPLYWLGKQDRSDEVNRITMNASVKWDFLPGFYFKATGSGYLAEQIDQSFQRATQTYTNIFSNPPSYSNTARASIAYNSRSFQKQFTGNVNYDKIFAGKHHVSAMVGAEYYGIKNLDMQVYGTNAPTDDISTVNASTTFVAGSNYSTASEYRMISTLGRVGYVFDQRFLINGSFRMDAASSLPKDNRNGFFPGVSAGWNVQNEKFFRNSSISNVVSTLKPRISYGQNGNVAGLGRYEVQGTYGSVGLYNNNAGFLNTGVVNNDLQWEKSKTIDAGADIGLFRDRVTLVFDYYDRKTSDLLTNLALPGYTGFSSVRTNLGTYQNRGYELTVNANVINKPNGLRLDVSANASYVKNKILQLPYNGQPNNRQNGAGAANLIQIYDPNQQKLVWVSGLQEGQPLGAIYAFKQVSIFSDAGEIAKVAGSRRDVVAQISGPGVTYGTGKITPGDVNWLDVDQNDTIDSRDQVYIGNIYPKWTGGFSLNVGYKGLSLFTRFEFALGHTIYNDLVARTLGNYQGTFNYIDWQKNAWSPTNTNTDIPKVYYADQVAAPLGKKNYTRSNNAAATLNGNNSRFYEKGDYLAAREITLAYDLPKTWLSKTKVLSQSRIYVSANNLFYITKFSGPSPEAPIDPGTGTINGIYQGTYPTPKSFVVGAQITF